MAEVDVINSNSFKQTQLKLDKQNLRLDKNHTDSMLLHNREYAELKRFLHSVQTVNDEEGEIGVPGSQTKLLRSVTAPDKESLALVPGGGEHQTPNRPKTVNQGVRRRSASESSVTTERGAGKGLRSKSEATSEPASPRKGSLAGSDRLPRLMLPPSPIQEDTPSWKRRSSDETPTKNAPNPPRERRKSSTVTVEFNMKGEAGGRRLSRTTSLDSHNNAPPRKSSIGLSLDLNNNRDRRLSASFPLTSNGYMAPTSNLLHPKGPHSDYYSSSSSRSSSPMSGMPMRRHSVAHPISSSTSIRKSVELSEGFAMDTQVYDPSIPVDPTGRRYSSSDEGSTASGPTPRSSLSLKIPAPKVSHAKSMEVMVASQKQILQRRKTMSQLNTRLMTPGECIEIQNKRRDRIHGSGSEDGSSVKGAVWAREPFFANQPGTGGQNRKNSVTDKETIDSVKN